MVLCILSDHNAVQLKIDRKQISSKYVKPQRLNSSLQNSEWVKGKNQERNKKFLELNEIVFLEKDTTQFLEHIKNKPMKKMYSFKYL